MIESTIARGLPVGYKYSVKEAAHNMARFQAADSISSVLFQEIMDTQRPGWKPWFYRNELEIIELSNQYREKKSNEKQN